MKVRALLLLLLFALPLSASTVVFDDSVPESIASVIAENVDKWTEGRGDLDIEISDYSEDDEVFDNRILASFTASSGGETLYINAVGRGREGIEEAIATEVMNILFYLDVLMEEPPRLDYIYNGTYSFLSDNYYRRGTRLKAVDNSGRLRGLFEVAERYDGAMLLEPLYLSQIVPGLSLESAGEWNANIVASMGFDFSSPTFEITASVSRSDLIYPFYPLLSFTYMLSNSESYYYGGLGIGASLDFWRMFPHISFTLIEEGRIGADVSVLLGMGPEGFAWNGRYSIYYEHSPLPFFYWRLGYTYLQGHHMVTLGGGGRF